MDKYIGKRFGVLTVKKAQRVGGTIMCDCDCICGKEIRVSDANLRMGKVKSCGCIRG